MTVTTTTRRKPGHTAARARQVAMALHAVAQYGLAVARPPRGATGRLAASGHTVAYVDGSHVAGDALRVPMDGAGPRAALYFSSPLAHLIESGTVARATKSGANRGRGPARPFVGPAGMAAESNAQGIMAPLLAGDPK